MAKRSCDLCVQRKIKCDRGRPCQRCIEANPPLECTYLKPVLKRGPKTSKLLQRWRAERQTLRCQSPGSGLDLDHQPISSPNASSRDFIPVSGPSRLGAETRRLPASVFTPVIEAYHSRMYPVWPVVHTPSLLARLEQLDQDDNDDKEIYILATALSAATMTQLSLAPLENDSQLVDNTFMEKECQRVRSQVDYREHPSVESSLTSFFLHVYHAKTDHRNSAMMYLQEAIALARLLHLDDISSTSNHDGRFLTEERIQQSHQATLLYPLLWVSERGYAIQHGLRVSIQETIDAANYPDDLDTYGQGLVQLGSLFAAFDQSLSSHVPRESELPASTGDQTLLVTIHDSLTRNTPRSTSYNMVQRTDYQITKQWMQILLWQQALSRGLLSSDSNVESMTFRFPARVAQDLLAFITAVSKDDLIPLGRDQLVKFFEITNTLADVILCTSAAPPSKEFGASPTRQSTLRLNGKAQDRHQRRECCRYGPADFLHGLYQTISPFLGGNEKLSVVLRQKVAEVLIQAPSWVLLPAGSSICDGERGASSSPPRRNSTCQCQDEHVLPP